MQKVWNHILDFLFPPSQLELKVRELSYMELHALKLPSLSPYPHITALFEYKNPLIRELVWQIKYKKNSHALNLAGEALHEQLLSYPSSPLLVPIPISNKRRKERGYNQCELLIQEICTNGIYETNFTLLTRPHTSEKQTFKKRRDRIEGSHNIFTLNTDIPKDTHIMIIDDVVTTGSTLQEALRVFNDAGYTHVRALTIAH